MYFTSQYGWVTPVMPEFMKKFKAQHQRNKGKAYTKKFSKQLVEYLDNYSMLGKFEREHWLDLHCKLTDKIPFVVQVLYKPKSKKKPVGKAMQVANDLRRRAALWRSGEAPVFKEEDMMGVAVDYENGEEDEFSF